MIVMIESLRTLSLRAKSFTITFKTNLNSIYIHLYTQFKNVVHQS